MMRVDPNELSNLRAPKTATKRKADWEAALEVSSIEISGVEYLIHCHLMSDLNYMMTD